MKGKTFVVVGGTRRPGHTSLGYETAAILAPDHNVVIISHDAAEVDDAVRTLGCKGMVADVSHHEALRHALKDVVAEYGTIDGLAHCAAIWSKPNGPLDAIPHDMIDLVIGVNAKGAAYVVKEALIHMKAQGFGNLVVIGAMATQGPRIGIPLYAATKWFVLGLVESVQQEAAQHGVKVMTFHPGPMETGLQDAVGAEYTDEIDMPAAAAAAETVRLLQLTPEDPLQSGHKVLNGEGRW